MSNQSLTILRADLEKQRINKKQLLALEKKAAEEVEKVTKLTKFMKQAEIDHEACLLSNLAGNTTDQKLEESKANLRKLADSIQEANETSNPMQKIKDKLLFEMYDLEGAISAHRSILCSELAKEAREGIAANKKLIEQLSEGFIAFISNGEPSTTWERFLLLNFPHPSQHDMQNAINKFKTKNEFMYD